MRTSELLVYGIVLVAFLVFNVLRPLLAERLRRMQRQHQGPQEPDQELEPAPEREERRSADEESWEETWGRSRQTVLQPSVEHAAQDEPAARGRAEVPAPSAQLRSRQGPASALFASRKELRHAVVLMTVLGPCRALEPHDNR
jgi:hypothetical protein